MQKDVQGEFDKAEKRPPRANCTAHTHTCILFTIYFSHHKNG